MQPNNTSPQDQEPIEQSNDNPAGQAPQMEQPSPQETQPQIPPVSPPSQPEAPVSFTPTDTGTPVPQPPAMPWDKPAQPSSQTRQFSQGNVSPQSSPASVFGANPQPGQPEKKNKKRIFTVFVGVLAGLLVLGGGITAAYFGVVVPNKPENVLKQAVLNTMEENASKSKGVLEFSEESSLSGKVEYEVQADREKKAFDGTFDITVSGVDVQVEGRYVDNNLYFKIGDLKTLSSLISGYTSMFAVDQAQVDQLLAVVSDKVADQWIVVDSTLLDTAGFNCIKDANFTLTEKDKQLLQDQYVKNQFVTIKNYKDDSVNGAAAIRYDLEVDSKKLNKYMNSLNDLSIVKTFEKCAGSPADQLDTDVSSAEEALPDKASITVWVDKDKKLITKTASTVSQPAIGDMGIFKVSAEDTVSYQEVSVEKPKDAKSFMQLTGELQQELERIFPEFTSGYSSFGEAYDLREDGLAEPFDSYMTQ